VNYTVEPMYHPRGGAYHRPYVVMVNGRTLMSKHHRYRRFKDSKSAAIAGAKEVDRLRAEAKPK
jgi:hypothetical protein